MTVADTSVWIDHLRGARGSRALSALLEAGEILLHPFVRGELALGHVGAKRAAILRDLSELPSAPLIVDAEVFEMVEARSLQGIGIGWVDAHLLASALAAGAALWTLDSPLARVASRMGIGWL